MHISITPRGNQLVKISICHPDFQQSVWLDQDEDRVPNGVVAVQDALVAAGVTVDIHEVDLAPVTLPRACARQASNSCTSVRCS